MFAYRAFASDFGDDDKGKNKKLEELKEKENIQKYKEAFEQIRKILGNKSKCFIIYRLGM